MSSCQLATFANFSGNAAHSNRLHGLLMDGSDCSADMSNMEQNPIAAVYIDDYAGCALVPGSLPRVLHSNHEACSKKELGGFQLTCILFHAVASKMHEMEKFSRDPVTLCVSA